ncbi:MAG: type VI secretion system membrane subunit TssM [Candidatus Manganitrophaceae bacterium]|nr:MAG: type VI secretion system membrane subunit TssM [Candidatus Manganitrophaceae bacterium]
MKFLLAVPKALINGMTRFPRITAAVGVFCLICLIWFAGPYLGLTKIETRLILIVALLFLWSLFLIIDRYRAERGAKQLEQSLQKQAQEQAVGSRPDRKEEIAELGNQFDKAVAALKQSKLGKGRSGRTALYALPWYMFIGPPASGKSTALLHSGLQFPYLGGSNRGVQGVGGTRNCDWWFTSEAVLLDTAGRYVTQDEDREEWYGFLDLLKNHRKGKPINGVLAAMSIAELLQASDEDLEYHAKNMRARIDELIQRLGIVFPVYLVFTKCDLIRGFVEFYEDFSKTEREQMWGATLPKNPPAGSSPQQLFETEFGQLFKALDARRVARLASARGAQKVRDVYSFPLQLLSGEEKLARFVELLFAHNPYQENPIFRGFYFTSGTQEGRPIDRILTAVSRASGLSEAVSDSFGAEVEAKSYFIKNLFTDVIFQDQILAGPSNAMSRQRGALRVAIFVGAVLITTLSVVGLSFSFVGNRVYLGSIRSSASKAAKMELKDERQFPKNIEQLDQLREGLDRLQTDAEKGIPFRMRGGLYRGGTLYPPMRDLYFQRLNQLVLGPTQGAIEAELERFASNPRHLPEGRDFDHYYLLLKIYLMMADPAHLDPAFLDQQLQQIWREMLPALYANQVPKGLQEGIIQQVAFYSRVANQSSVPRLTLNEKLVQQVRQGLRAIPLEERLYSRVRREATGKSEPYTLQTALKGGGEGALLSDYKIPALFTEGGWKGPFKESLDRILQEKGVGGEAWVLGQPEPEPTAVEAGIEKLYFEEYQRQWNGFLESIRLKPADGLAETEKLFAALSQENSPLVVLFTEIDRNTNLRRAAPQPIGGMAKGMVDRVKEKLGMERSASDAASASTAQPTPVSNRFQPFHEFVAPADPQKEAPVARLVAELRRAHEALRPLAESGGDPKAAKALVQGMASGQSNDLFVAQKNAERLLQSADPEIRRVVAPIFLQPFRMASSGLVSGAMADLNRRWRGEVYEPCQQSIAGRYPFKKDGEDATLTDVAEFFHPQNGTLWKFYDKELKSFVDEGAQRWEVKRTSAAPAMSPDFLESLRRARMLSEGLFPRGNPDLKLTFDLYPYPSSGVSEILISADGKDLRYRNEPQEWHEFSWPGPSGTPGAVLQVQSGGSRQVQQYGGRWGFFKLLDAARITPVSSTIYKIEWELKGGDGKVIKVRYDLRAQSYKNPFKPGFFSESLCPGRIG